MKKEQAIDLIKALSDANGVSGFEEEVVAIAKATTKSFTNQKTDGIKNLYLEVPQNTGQRPVIQLDAHSDEVGFIVQAIKPNGLIKFLPLGGWVAANIAAQKVRIRNQAGQYIKGIVTSTPPHFLSEEQRNKGLTFDDLFIDVGASSKEEVETTYQVQIGAPVVPDVQCEYEAATDKFLGKAFDCRIGCACMLDVLEELQHETLACDVVATMSSQEEVGDRGAIVAAKQVQADIAIVFEGCPADDTSVEDYLVQSALGKGPMLRNFDVSMITNPEFQNFAVETAAEFGLPMQLSVRKGGGTNGAAINQVKGAPAIVIGVPVRYAHTPHCYIAYEDYQVAKELALALIKKLTPEVIETLVYSV